MQEIVQPIKALKIKVLGVGGGGNNAVIAMMNSGITGVEYIIANTEKGILSRVDSSKCKTIQLGVELTKGLGAGADPEVGEKAARESEAELEKAIDGADLLFVTAGMGGGTGTGAIPVIADIAKRKGILTVGVVTRPFVFEGKLRSVRANMGIEKLRPNVNSLIIISNDQLLKNTDNTTTVLEAFKMTDDILRQAIQSVTEIIQTAGTINVDFADVKTVLNYEGYAYFGIGTAEGELKVEEATMTALNNPLVEKRIDGAKGVIFNIKGGTEISLDDVNRSAELIAEKVSPDANVIWGTVIDQDLGEKVEVTVVATSVNPE